MKLPEMAKLVAYILPEQMEFLDKSTRETGLSRSAKLRLVLKQAMAAENEQVTTETPNFRSALAEGLANAQG